MKKLLILIIICTIQPLSSYGSGLCSAINSADLDVSKYRYDKDAYNSFYTLITDFINEIADAQILGADNIADDVLETMRSEVKSIIDADTARKIPKRHNAFMRQYNEYSLKHRDMALSGLFPDEWILDYEKMFVDKLKQYARLQNETLKKTACDIKESVRALETLVLVDAYFQASLLYGDPVFRSAFKKTVVDYINKCPLKGTVKARIPYPQEMKCVSTANSYIEPDPYFYAWNLGSSTKTKYEGRVDCRHVDPEAGITQSVSYATNMSTARLKLDDKYKVSLETTVQFYPDVEAYMFMCKTMALPRKKLSRTELRTYARRLSQEGRGCVVMELNQDSSGGDVSIVTEGVDIMHGRGTPGYTGPPTITAGPPDKGPIISGEARMDPENPPVILNWKCTAPYKVISTNVNEVVTDGMPLRIFEGTDLKMEIEDQN